MVTSTVLFILAHRRRSTSTPWIFYCPVAFIMLSLAQAGNMLLGFQVAWFMVMLSFAATVFLLDRFTLTWPVLVFAVAAAVVGSFSSLQGLLIWPVGLLLLWRRHRPRKWVITWITAGTTSWLLYFSNFDFRVGSAFNGSPTYAIHHARSAIAFFLSAIGIRHWYLGVIILIAALWLVISRGLRWRESNGSLVGVAMASYGLLFAVVVTIGRSSYGAGDAQEAVRVATFDLLILAGCYLAALDPPPAGPIGDFDATPIRILRPLLLAIGGLVVFFGFTDGIAWAQTWYPTEALAADVAANAGVASNGALISALVPGQAMTIVPTIRSWARTGRRHDLAQLQTGRPNLDLRPVTEVVLPHAGATLRGSQLLDASASVNQNSEAVTRVSIVAWGPSFRHYPIAGATRTPVGWLADWNTTSVPNGTYFLRSTAYIFSVPSAPSRADEVKVDNRR